MQDLTTLVTRFGLPLVFLNVLLEQGGLPLPAIPTLIVAGALAARGNLPVLPLLLTAAFASLIADSVWFRLGRVHGSLILKTLCRISLSPDSCVKQTEALFERWGLPSLLVAKFIPGFSTVAPPMAGATGAPVVRFVLYDLAGALLWAGSGIGLGLVFHTAVDDILASLGEMGGRALLLLGLLLALFIASKWWQRRRFYRVLRMARISPPELSTLMQSESAPAIFDVRSARARARDPRRIPGAYALELATLEAHLPDLPRHQEIVLYCT